MSYLILLSFSCIFSAEDSNDVKFILSALKSNIQTLEEDDGIARYSIDAMISYAALKFNVEEELLHAVMQVESSGNPLAISSANAVGLFQLLPSTCKTTLGGLDPYDTTSNILGGAMYLQMQISEFGGLEKGLQAYHAGPGNQRRGTVGKASKKYAVKVLKLYEQLKQEK